MNKFSNVGTHIPLPYDFGPGYKVVDPEPTPTLDSEELYWEKDDVNPNQVIYDLENNKTIIPSSEEEITVTPPIKNAETNFVRNVSGTRYRNNR